MNSFRTCLFSIVMVLGFTVIAEAKETVVIVTGMGSNQQEELAAKEIAAQFEKLFDAETEITHQLPQEAKFVVLVGTPKTNPAISTKDWPKMSDQGHLVQSRTQGEIQTVVVGGGSPTATLWAAYELGYQYGIRYLMQKDVYPKTPIKLDLTGHDVLLEPQLKTRIFQLATGSPLSFESWSSKDLVGLLKQLSKLKFNYVELEAALDSPILNLTQGVLWKGEIFPVKPDNPGSVVFKGADIFTNPDFLEISTPEERKAANLAFFSPLLEAAITNGIDFKYKSIGHKITPGVQPVILAKNPIAPLSQSHTRAVSRLLSESNPSGFITRFQIPAEQDAALHYLSRVAFDPAITPRKAHDDFFNTITLNQSSTDRLWLAFGHLEAASNLLDEKGRNFAKPGPKMLMKHFTTKPLPEWWEEVKEHYTQNMIEMYRSNDQIKTAGREETYYYAKRSEFNVEYLGAVEALRAAAVAKQEGDLDTALEQMELALESLYNSIDTLSDIARNPSDRGLIALLNKHAFEPLNAAYEKMLEEE